MGAINCITLSSVSSWLCLYDLYHNDIIVCVPRIISTLLCCFLIFFFRSVAVVGCFTPLTYEILHTGFYMRL